MGTARLHPNWLTAGDPLRGLAAFGVLLFHVATWAVLTNTDAAHADTLGSAGRILFNLDVGVFLFFLLSGYLIGRPFASAFVLQTPFPRVGRYVVRRALRLGPGLAAATLLAVAVFGSRFQRGTVHFWTLGAEACFYAVLPVATAASLLFTGRIRGPRSRAALWVAGTIAAAAASGWFRHRGTAFDFGRQHLFPSVAFAFAPGVALAGLEPLLAPRLRAAPHLARRGGPLLVLLAAAAGVAYLQTPRAQFMQHSLLAVLACAGVLAAVLVRHWAQLPAWRALDNPPLQWLGERSYSLYLFHLAIVALVARELGTSASAPLRVVITGAVAIPLALVAAWAGYALVERPFMVTRTAADEVSAVAAEAAA